MSLPIISTPLAYNTGSPIYRTQQIGDLAIGTSAQDYTLNPGGVQWWMGPDENDGFVIGVPVSSSNQPTPLGISASVGFYKSSDLTDSSFVSLSNNVFNQNFTTAESASIWLTNNGYWSSYVTPSLYLDAGNVSSYPGSGSVWRDLVAGREFNLLNGPTYGPLAGGIINFNASSGQYAECTSSLPDLGNWSVAVWHYYTGNINSSESPCIVTEYYVGGAINYSLGSLGDNSPYLQSGFWNAGWNTTPAGYTLTPNNWYLIVGTYDGSAVKLYVNNSLVASSNTTTTSLSSNAGIRLMRRWDAGQYWDGLLATVGIYNKALTSGQISNIWNSTKSRFGL